MGTGNRGQTGRSVVYRVVEEANHDPGPVVCHCMEAPRAREMTPMLKTAMNIPVQVSTVLSRVFRRTILSNNVHRAHVE